MNERVSGNSLANTSKNFRLSRVVYERIKKKTHFSYINTIQKLHTQQHQHQQQQLETVGKTQNVKSIDC
jgi:hypothetical protein